MSTNPSFQAALHRYSRRYHVDPDDLGQEVFLRLLAGEDVPDAVGVCLSEMIRKEAENMGKRERRRARRVGTTCNIAAAEDDCTRRASDPQFQLIFNEARNNAVHDDFDREALPVILDEHPRFRSFREFAKSQTHCSSATAYRRRRAIIERLKSSLQEVERLT